MKIITYHNVTKFSEESLNSLRKIADVFTPIRKVISYRGAEYEVRINGLSDVDQTEILSIKITDPNQFCPNYFMISRIEPTIKEQIEVVSEHFGKPEQVEIDMDGLRIVVSTPTKNPRDAKIIGARVTDLEEVLEQMPSMDILNVRKEAIEKAKEYFEQ